MMFLHRLGVFLLLIGGLLLILFVISNVAEMPDIRLLAAGAMLGVGGFVLRRKNPKPPPPPSERFRVLKRKKKRKDQEEE